MSKKSTHTPDNTNANGELLDAPDTRPDDRAIREDSINQKIEAYLSELYEFRFNIIKQKPEYRPKGEKQHFKPMDKYKLLSLKRELDAVGFHKCSKETVKDILGGSFSPAVNPVKQYFKDLPKWDGQRDYIAELCATVKAKNPQKWHEYFKKWLVAVVANVFIDEKCANHTMLVLTGAQGKFKTTWLENLCPKNLINYLYTGKLNLENKDCLTLIAENLFVNIDDQLKQLHKRDENELKNLITINYVKYRRPYDEYITEYPHLCSFMGSVNGNEFLSDPTGSRRFLPFEVENINISAAQGINMNLVWAQAYAYFNSKTFRYWFKDEEIDELNEHNAAFQMISQEEELISHYYAPQRPGTISPGTVKFLPNTLLLAELEIKSGLKRLSQKKIGEALMKLGFERKKRTHGGPGKVQWGYIVYEKSNEEIQTQTAELEQSAAPY